MSDRSNNDLSVILSRLLDSYGLNEGNRSRRIQCQKLLQLFMSWQLKPADTACSILLSGSAYEATTLDGLSSDVDIMLIINTFRVIDNIHQWRPGVPTYMMERTGCYPAFVKLYLLSNDYPGPAYNDTGRNLPTYHYIEEDGKMLLCNDIKEHFLGKPPGSVIHGPAITILKTKFLLENDYVLTLKCESFPDAAIAWKNRQTQQMRELIGGAATDDVEYCYLVGLGNKGSPTENAEWRISFSHIENQLVHSWNNVVYKCYVMMKFINKGLIKPLLPDVLCSYHFKTILMWMVEKYNTVDFTESNFNNCLIMTLNNLTSAVKCRSLPHYFIEGCNLFYNKLDDKSAQAITAILEQIVDNWPHSLFNIKIRKLGISIQACLSSRNIDTICENIAHQRKQTYSFEILDGLYDISRVYMQRKFELCRKDRTQALQLLFDFKMSAQQLCLNHMESRNFIIFVMKDIFCNIGLQFIRCSTAVPNKRALHYKRIGLRCINLYINDCCLQTSLQIAGEFVLMGCYERALKLLKISECQINEATLFHCTHEIGCIRPFTRRHCRIVFDNKPSMQEFCKCYFAAAVMYTRDNLPHVPKVLVYEMFRSATISSAVSNHVEHTWYNHAVVHCNVYLLYLRFLCFHVLKCHVHRQVTFDSMTVASNKLKALCSSHLETNHNILGYCCMTLGQLHKAYREYKKSLSIQK